MVALSTGNKQLRLAMCNDQHIILNRMETYSSTGPLPLFEMNSSNGLFQVMTDFLDKVVGCVMAVMKVKALKHTSTPLSSREESDQVSRSERSAPKMHIIEHDCRKVGQKDSVLWRQIILKREPGLFIHSGAGLLVCECRGLADIPVRKCLDER